MMIGVAAQRSMDYRGRSQVKAVGEALRQHGLSLAAIGGWEVSRAALGRVEAQVPPTHYKCYQIKVVKTEGKIPKQVE